MGPVKKIKRLVIDSGAFLKNVPIWEYGEEFFSIDEVVSEIKDQHTKDFIKSLPVQIDFRKPSPGAIKFMNEFAKKIGENTLSVTDLKLLALTYDLEVEAKGRSDHLRTEPVQRKPVSVASKPPAINKIEGFYVPAGHQDSNNEGDDQKEAESKTSISETSDLKDNTNILSASDVPSVTEDNTNILSASDVPSVTEVIEAVSSLNISVPSNLTSVSEDGEPVESLDINQQSNSNDYEYTEDDENNDDPDNYDDDDDEEGWITPSNIKEIKEKNSSVCEDDYKDVEVACMTGDFGIQNTLLHVGLSTLGVNGMLIKSLKMFTLRCFVCGTLCSDMERVFCKKCGYKTLKKVSYTLNPDGTKFIWFSKKPINIRGMKYSLPAPRGGKHAINPILSEDQRIPQMRPSKRFLQRNDPLNEDYISRADTTPFLLKDSSGLLSSYLANSHGFSHELSKRGAFYWEKKNIKAPKKNGRSKRKS